MKMQNIIMICKKVAKEILDESIFTNGANGKGVRDIIEVRRG